MKSNNNNRNPMTNAEIIATIRAEIVRLKNQLVRGACAAQIEMETNCKEEAYDEVLSFISTLESEHLADARKTSPNDLEDAANEFANQDCVTFISRKNGFIAGAKWQKEQMMKDAEETELYWDGDFLAIDLNMAALGYSERDKVRVIVLPKED